MIPSEMKRIEVWSGRLRLAHWLLALTTLVLTATGWLSLQGLHDRLPMFMSMHAAAGYGLAAALALRIYLLFFGQGPEHWRDLIPRGPQFKAVGEMLLFYITLGRRSLPAYYAHNPLWAPIHLLLFGLLVMLAASGLVLGLADASTLAYYEASPWVLGYTLPELHQAALPIIVSYAAAHVMAVFVHDWRSGGSEISAIIGGYKVFIIRRAVDTLPDNVRPISIERLRDGPGRGGRP